MPKLPRSDKPTLREVLEHPQRYPDVALGLREIADQFTANLMQAGELFGGAWESGQIQVPVDSPLLDRG